MCGASVSVGQIWAGGFTAEIEISRWLAGRVVELRMPGTTAVERCFDGIDDFATLGDEGAFSVTLGRHPRGRDGEEARGTCKFAGDAADSGMYTVSYNGSDCSSNRPPRLLACEDVSFAWSDADFSRGVLTFDGGWESGRRVRLDFGERDADALEFIAVRC